MAKELTDSWVWCNVYPVTHFCASKKICEIMKEFSAIDRYSKKKRGDTFLKRKADFVGSIDELFDIFSNNPQQRRKLEEHHQLRMTEADYAFYEDHKGARIAKCLHVVETQSQADQLFIRRVKSRDTAAPTTSHDSSGAQTSTSFQVSFECLSGSDSVSTASSASLEAYI